MTPELARIFVPRSEWGARDPRYVVAFEPPHRGLAIHWTGSPRAAGTHWPSCYRQVAGIQNYHMDAPTHRWPDIGYSALVCNHGFVFEGRWTRGKPTAQGVAGENYNDDYAAIAWIGGPGDELSDAARHNIGHVVDHFTAAGFPRVLRPHSWFKVTSCPGPTLSSLITAGEWSTPRATPPAPPTAPPAGATIPLLAAPSVSIEQLQRHATARGYTPRYRELMIPADFESRRLGVDTAATAAIMEHETNGGRYTGVVPATFHNWGGIKTRTGGADDDAGAHHRFPSDLVGVRAVAQHIALYAGAWIPPEDVVDPRHFDSIRGQAPELPSDGWEWGRDGQAHAANIAAKIRRLRLA